jgi:hypothetical protein
MLCWSDFQNRVALGLTTALVVAMLRIGAVACTRVAPMVQTGPTFRVRAMDRGQPVQGLRLRLAEYGSDEFEHQGPLRPLTDQDGFATFTMLPPGAYRLGTDSDSEFERATVVVKADGPPDMTIPLRWPVQDLIRVRSATGSLNVPNDEPRLRLPLSVALVEGLSGRVLETIQTGSEGQFTIANVTPGIYFLEVKPKRDRSSGADVRNLAAIEVSPEADQESLDIDVGWSGCGFMYTDHGKCSHNPLEVSKVCGYVSDPSAGAVRDAYVALLEQKSRKPLVQTRTDTSGRFYLGELKEGTYDLTVRSPGFYQFRRTVRLSAPTASETCEQPITIRLGIAATCSSAEVAESR